jgi:hypothetical protein
MEWTALGWRDGILLLVVLAAIYLVLMLLRLTQIGRGRDDRNVQEPLAGPSPDTVSLLRKRREDPVAPATLPVESTVAPELPAQPAPLSEWDEVRSLFGDVPSAPQRPTGFGEHLAEHLARSDVEMEVQRMRSEMERMRSEVEQLRAARNVSPQYAEAMELAQRGKSAQQIADHLGISLAEAELVHALSRSDRKFDEGDEHGADRFAT